MSVFIRRFGSDPGNEVFLEIEAVNILDLDPPAAISGVGTGTVLMVGEFEDGDFNTIIAPTGASDLVKLVGELGYRYGGVPGNYPCAVSRKADGAIVPEYWNGNGIVQLNGKKFRRLLLTRVDTSVGTMTFRRQAYLTGESAFAYNLEPGNVLSLSITGDAVYTSATFSATAATITSGAGTYPSGFTGGETLTLGYDDASNFTVTFLAADQTLTQVISRINAYAGFSFADTPAADTIRFTSPRRGTGASVRIVSGTASVLTALNIAVSTSAGTGNVGNIDAVTFSEVKSIVEAAFTAVASGVTVEQDSAGRPRISKNYEADDDFITVGSATTATALGFAVGDHASLDGKARHVSGAGTYATLFAGGETLTLGYDDASNFLVTFLVGDQTQTNVIDRINAAAGFTFASAVGATKIKFTGLANGGNVRVVAASGAGVLTTLGLAVTTVTADGIVAGTMPAGTLVTNAAQTAKYVTMQTIAWSTDDLGPLTAPIRHAVDDGTGTSSLAGTLVELGSVLDVGSFSAVNLTSTSAALTESQIDAQYTTALEATLDLNTDAREVNVIYSARQSNSVRRALKTNATTASDSGLFGRIAIIRTPMGTTQELARSRVAEPGVGAYRSQRVVYCYPQASTTVPIIQRRGLGGGTGFTASGTVDAGADGFLASIMSQLAPEENPGQLTGFTTGVVGLESSPNAQGFDIGTYTSFKAAGICALRIADGTAIFQSGVTSVDPGVFPNLKNIARRRMADFLQDSLARRSVAFGKKTSTSNRRKALATEIRTFLNDLLSANKPDAQRIAAFSIDTVSGNTATTLKQGIFRIVIKVQTLASLDAIVLEVTAGETVTVDEVLPQAA